MVIITKMRLGDESEPFLTSTTRRVALVTGAAGGIGRAVCQALARDGLHVAALDNDEAQLTDAASWLEAQHLPTSRYVADIADPAAVERVVGEVEQRDGPIEVAVSVAGILRTASVIATSDSDWRATLETNLSGPFFLFRSVARRMLPRRRGNLVAVGSNAGVTPRVNMSAYAASKAGLLSLVRCLGLELAPAGIRCNVVSPGSTDTPMQRAFWTEAQGEREVLAGSLANYRLGIPLQRIAEPEDVAEAVRFLASERARHITLHDLRVDGGATLDA
jgi:2,3-dihydro-2,3-dihydroxybenzoate dehydrogenase